jgi:hypothetical protein
VRVKIVDQWCTLPREEKFWRFNEKLDYAICTAASHLVGGKSTAWPYPLKQFNHCKNIPVGARYTQYAWVAGEFRSTPCKFRRADKELMYYNSDTKGGWSGGPVVDDSTGLVVGMHLQGDVDAGAECNSAVPVFLVLKELNGAASE